MQFIMAHFISVRGFWIYVAEVFLSDNIGIELNLPLIDMVEVILIKPVHITQL
jgi:hypothetical protein